MAPRTRTQASSDPISPEKPPVAVPKEVFVLWGRDGKKRRWEYEIVANDHQDKFGFLTLRGWSHRFQDQYRHLLAGGRITPTETFRRTTAVQEDRSGQQLVGDAEFEVPANTTSFNGARPEILGSGVATTHEQLQVAASGPISEPGNEGSQRPQQPVVPRFHGSVLAKGVARESPTAFPDLSIATPSAGVLQGSIPIINSSKSTFTAWAHGGDNQTGLESVQQPRFVESLPLSFRASSGQPSPQSDFVSRQSSLTQDRISAPGTGPSRKRKQVTPSTNSPSPRPRKIVTLNVNKLPKGFHVDPITMAPVRDPKDVSNKIKDVIQNLYDVQSQTHGFVPETQDLLIDKMAELTQSLSDLQRLTDKNLSPNNPVHTIDLAPEIVDYVDDGRNPDIFTRDFVELVQRGNAVVNGKKQAFRGFSQIYARKLKEGIGGVNRHVDAVMEAAGIEQLPPSQKAENGEKRG